MKRLGELLMWLGVGVGVGDALAIAVHLQITGVPWFVAVALAKFAMISAGGLMASGAVVRRLASRAEARRLAQSTSPGIQR